MWPKNGENGSGQNGSASSLFPSSKACATGARVSAQLNLTRTYSSSGQHAPQWRTAAGAHRHPRGADTGTAPIAKRILDKPILERVVRDHHHPGIRRHGLAKFREATFQARELVVYRDSQSLENPRLILGFRDPAERPVEDSDQVVTCPERCRGPTLDDGPCKPPGAAFLSIFVEDPS